MIIVYIALLLPLLFAFVSVPKSFDCFVPALKVPSLVFGFIEKSSKEVVEIKTAGVLRVVLAKYFVEVVWVARYGVVVKTRLESFGCDTILWPIKHEECLSQHIC